VKRKLLSTVATTLGAVHAFAHGPQIQLTNDANAIATRQLLLDGHYNTYPAPATPATSVYIMPLGPTSAFGGTRWFTRPNGAFNSGPGVAFGYGWIFDDGGTPSDISDDIYTTTFPVGARFRQTMSGELGSWNGSTFVDAADAQLYMFRGSGASLDAAISGSADATITYSAISAPAGPSPDPHVSASFEVLGDGVVPSDSHPPAPVLDGIYLIEFQLDLINQPVGSSIVPSDPFHFVMYKGVDASEALSAAQAAFPGASIQLVPEPMLVSLAPLTVLLLRRRRT
jgi:hypothetical protein